MASTYELIETTTLSSSASSVTFSSITQDYRDLVLVCNFETTTVGLPNLVFNSDTGSNYSYVYAKGDGSASSSGSNTTGSLSFTQVIYSNTSTPYLAIANLLDYSATDKHKSILSRANNLEEPTTGNKGTGMQAGRWANTSAINTILIRTGGSGDFEIGSTFALYGIAS